MIGGACGCGLSYLAGVALLRGCVVLRGNFGHAKVTPTVPDCWQLKMTAMLELLASSTTDLFCIGCLTAGLRTGEAEGLGAGLK